ncbi:MAG: SUF system NifU family Fe-S cluster assembly protein [Planctomycetota bacterium]|nr:SUF system NifU family Fe-S cluster assembly protein [Planctomycetota bacterium]
MSELRELYQELILDHNRSPKNKRAIPTGQHAEGFNPLCGDRVTVYAQIEDERIVDVSFQGDGCAISTASASLMTQALKGKTVDEAARLFGAFQRMVTGAPDDAVPTDALGKLVVLQGVCEFPMRVKCATLAWHTFNAALKESDDTVTTE